MARGDVDFNALDGGDILDNQDEYVKDLASDSHLPVDAIVVHNIGVFGDFGVPLDLDLVVQRFGNCIYEAHEFNCVRIDVRIKSIHDQDTRLLHSAKFSCIKQVQVVEASRVSGIEALVARRFNENIADAMIASDHGRTSIKVSIFSNGKVSVTGARSLKSATIAMEKVARALRRRIDSRVALTAITPTNVLAVYRFKHPIILAAMAKAYKGSIYDPFRFSGVRLRIPVVGMPNVSYTLEQILGKPPRKVRGFNLERFVAESSLNGGGGLGGSAAADSDESADAEGGSPRFLEKSGAAQQGDTTSGAVDDDEDDDEFVLDAQADPGSARFSKVTAGAHPIAHDVTSTTDSNANTTAAAYAHAATVPAASRRINVKGSGMQRFLSTVLGNTHQRKLNTRVQAPSPVTVKRPRTTEVDATKVQNAWLDDVGIVSQGGGVKFACQKEIVTANVFSSGNVTFTGARSITSIQEALQIIFPFLEKYNVESYQVV